MYHTTIVSSIHHRYKFHKGNKKTTRETSPGFSRFRTLKRTTKPKVDETIRGTTQKIATYTPPEYLYVPTDVFKHSRYLKGNEEQRREEFQRVPPTQFIKIRILSHYNQRNCYTKRIQSYDKSFLFGTPSIQPSISEILLQRQQKSGQVSISFLIVCS